MFHNWVSQIIQQCIQEKNVVPAVIPFDNLEKLGLIIRVALTNPNRELELFSQFSNKYLWSTAVNSKSDSSKASLFYQ